jgi:hypothetical protein
MSFTEKPLFRILVVFAAVGLIGLLYRANAGCTDCEPADRIKCASNLKQIGLAVSMYAKDHGGRYPDRFEDLIVAEDIGSEVFVCPKSDDTPAKGRSVAEMVGNLSAGGHLSYVYLGKGWDVKTVNPSAVLAYEPLSNHDGLGGNILYGDGHFEFMNGGDSIWATLAKQ